MSFVHRAHHHLRNGDPASAEALLRSGLTAQPQSIEGWCSLADTLTRRHAYEEALDASRRALQAGPGDPRALVSRARTLRAMGQLSEALYTFTEALGGPPLPPPLRAHALMELGQTLDRLGNYDEAWQAISLGQQLRRQLAIANGLYPRWLSDHLGALNAWLDQRPPPPRPVPWDDPRPLPVFLVGVPRSGTTLMEQILVAAGSTSTAERPILSRALADTLERRHLAYPQDLDAFSPEIVHAVRDAFFAKAALPTGTQILHKLPLDLLHLALVDRIFPGARVVQALRDPRDTVVSGYLQNLVLNPAMLNWTHPRQLAVATRGLLQLGQRWANDLELLDLRVQRYDQLTDDPAQQMRALVDHAGLRWTPTVERFHELARHRSIGTPSSHEVIKPVHRAARARWRRYEPHLSSVLPVLEPLVDAYGFGRA